MNIPSQVEISRGCEEYIKQVKRDVMYDVALFHITHFWGNTHEMANALGVLLLTWNAAFYQYRTFDYNRLEECLSRNTSKLEGYKNRDILGLSTEDEKGIIDLFDQFNDALKIADGSRKGIKSPVSAAKALHLLAPNFFPAWDNKISLAYDCHYGNNPAHEYVSFCKKVKEEAHALKPYLDGIKKPMLKVLDEYNFSKYTKGWI